MKLACPLCGASTEVYESWAQGTMMLRRRRCENGHKFKTTETVTTAPLSRRRALEPPTVDIYNSSAEELEEGLRSERGW